MRTIIYAVVAFVAFVISITIESLPSKAQDVIMTPLGTHSGQFCRRDRAMVFEDPNGTRILYDAGRSVLGGSDPRLGHIDIVLLSSVHSDHLGDRVPAALNAGPCAQPDLTVSKLPNSNTAEIAATTGASVVVGGEMHTFLAPKIVAAGGNASQAMILRHGGKRTIGGVQIAVVPAHHSNGAGAGFLTENSKAEKEMKDVFADNGLTAYVGPENGYVLTFSNGLVVYLSGDTGHTSDMATIVKGYYNATVAIVNMGDLFSMGPEEAAWAVNNLLKPKTAIAQHANEASAPGALGAKVTTFIQEVTSADVIVPFSGVAISCDAMGNCTQ